MQMNRMILGPLRTNCYIIWENYDAVVIDPGASGEKIAQWLTEQKLNLNKILLTHSHFDHIGGVKELKESFMKAEIVIGTNEAHKLTEKRMHFPYPVNKEAYSGLSADITVSQGDTVNAGTMCFSVLDTPGHTAGGVCYICNDWIFSGDTLFYQEVGRTDLDGGDYNSLLISLKKLNDLQGNFRIFPGHDRETTLDNERKFNPYVLEAQRCIQ
jgi:glyoxylase-like metal-dependent hydrolase (beta-lactamase superfamily II)